MIKLTAHGYSLPDEFGHDDGKRYEWQMGIRANYLLLGDKNQHVPVDIITGHATVIKSNLIWLRRGELIAGSFMSNYAYGADIKNKDIDIYFKNTSDRVDFMALNKMGANEILFKTPVAVKVSHDNQILNLINGVAYKDAADLISHFDIRACSIACDPQHNLVYAVKGATNDASSRRIVFNPVPHNTTIARVIKYVERGFSMDAHQRLFFSELIKSDMYNPDLELSTGYRAVTK